MHSKVQIMGYVAMYKSQNWYFWRKLLFFDPGGALKWIQYSVTRSVSIESGANRSDGRALLVNFVFAVHRSIDLESKRNTSNLAISIQSNVNGVVKKAVVLFLHQLWNVNQIVNAWYCKDKWSIYKYTYSSWDQYQINGWVISWRKLRYFLYIRFSMRITSVISDTKKRTKVFFIICPGWDWYWITDEWYYKNVRIFLSVRLS